MKTWPAAVVFAGSMWCIPLQVQTPGTPCSDVPPDHQFDRNGSILPEYLEWDPDRCPQFEARPSPSGTISAHRLAHKPLKAAHKEFDRGMHAWRKGQSSEALEHMAEAIRLDPNFVEAQTEAGAIYAVSGKLELALDYFNRALALEPTWAPPNAGKASVLVMLNRDQEAEQAARAALQYDPGSIPAHYMLGIALVRQEKNTREAVVHLKVAADKFPTARAFLAAAEAELAKKQD